MTASASPFICVITTIHPLYDARVYARELITLVDQGWRVSFVTPWPRTTEADDRHSWVQVPFSGSRVGRILHGWNVFWAAMAQDADLYHFHDLDFLPWAVLLRWVKGVPVVYDCHEVYPEGILYNKPWIPWLLRRPLSILTRMVENAGVRLLGNVVVPVASLAERFGRLGVRVSQVRNVARWTAQRSQPHHRGAVCTAGLSKSYGIHVIVDIARELRRLGWGDLPIHLTDRFTTSALRAEILEILRREGLNIQIHPKVSPNRMGDVLGLGKVGLATEQSSPEMLAALPTKLFEYMAFGMPVVASPLPLSRQAVEEAECGLVLDRADDAHAFAEAIIRLHEDEATFERYRENGFRAVETIFNWDVEKLKLVRHVERELGFGQP